MLLYILKIRPQRWSRLFKIVPFTIMVTFGLSTYFQIRENQLKIQNINELTILGSIILFPALYMCFRFGYLKTLHDTSLIVFKWTGLCLFGIIFLVLITLVNDHSPPSAHILLFIAKIILFVIMVISLYRQSKMWTETNDNYIPFQKSHSTSRTRKW